MDPKTETDHHRLVIEKEKYSWQKAILFFNVATIVSSLSIGFFGFSLSDTIDKYQKLSAATSDAKKSMLELKTVFKENNEAVEALYKQDSTKQAQFRLNKKKVFNSRKETPSIKMDTILYVNDRYYQDLGKRPQNLGLKN